MTLVDRPQADIAVDVFTGWLDRYGAAMQGGDVASVAGLFRADGYWRDVLSFTGSYRTFHGAIVKSMPPDQTPKYFAIGAPSRAFENQRPFTV